MYIPTVVPPVIRFIRWLLFVTALVGAGPGMISAEYISNRDKYAWSESTGWTNFHSLYGGVTVYSNYLSGYAWHENLGWIKLGADGSGPYLNTTTTNWGVNRDVAGNLSGYAWSAGWGWIKFNPATGGVTIDAATKNFSGFAWAENFGWINFKNLPGAPVSYQVTLLTTSNINTNAKMAWAENAGWMNLRPLSGGVIISANYLSGYAWHENLGWIKLGSADASGSYMNSTTTNWGVNRDLVGNLSGYAWSEEWGWINFNPSGGGVNIDPETGAFSGYAWAENFGWISFRSQSGAQVAYGVSLITYTLNLVFSGTGSGSVSSTSLMVSCNTNCKKTFMDITSLKLTAAASQYSSFGGWQGCDTSNGADCNLTLDQDRTTTVSFNKDTEHVARIDGSTPAYFATLQAAYDNAGSSNIIQVWGIDLVETLTCGLSNIVTISGGYDQQFQNRNGTTIIRGLTISRGTVSVDRIVIR